MNYAKLVLSGRYRETGDQTGGLFTASKRTFRYDEFKIRVEWIIKDRRIDRVLLELKEDFQPGLFAGLEELRRQVGRLRGAGKTVFIFAKSYSTLGLYLAASCDEKILHPLGSLSFLGLSRTFLFFKGIMDRHGLGMEIIRRGKYKSAGDRFRTESLDRAAEEEYRVYFSSTMAEIRRRVAEGFDKRDNEIDELLNGRILDAEEARAEAWIDRSCTVDTLEKEWREEKKRKKKKLKSPGSSYGKGRKRIAVLVFEGAVVDGKTRRLPLLGQAVGSDSFVPEIEKLRKDRRVKGVVLRINSGGGSAAASEDILDALSRLGEKKPLIVSMSEVAGSGGYWISCAARRLFVSGTSLTGSIGVIVMLGQLREFLRRHGITETVLKTAPHADLGSALRQMTEKER